MSQVELSIIQYPETLIPAVERFELGCQLRRMTWDNAWERLTKIALYRSGADVSQIGSTWLDSLVETGGVRPFTAEELEAIGGPSVFLPASWQTVSVHALKAKAWAIPWLSDVRVVFYWRDMLEEEAGAMRRRRLRRLSG